MSELTPEIAADVVAACQAGAEEASGALSRTFDTELTMAVSEAGDFDPASSPDGPDGPDGLAGAGLAVLMTFGETGVVAVLPAATGLVPEWVAEPDATGESKLSTLAQELSMLLVPETLMADDFKAAWVGDLPAALDRAGVAAGAARVPLLLSAGEQSGELTLVWPAAAPGELFDPPADATDEVAADAQPAAAEAPDVDASAVPATEAPAPRPTRRQITDASQLPAYSKSLLKVAVPVTVCLASKRQTVDEIVGLGPGAIITFEKSCDEPVHLTVGEEPIALGEVVKVGEKFGIRIDQMVMPEESFKQVRRQVG